MVGTRRFVFANEDTAYAVLDWMENPPYTQVGIPRAVYPMTRRTDDDDYCPWCGELWPDHRLIDGDPCPIGPCPDCQCPHGDHYEGCPTIPPEDEEVTP